MARWQQKDLSVFESSCHLPTCLPHIMEASHCPFNCWTSSREAVNTNFSSLWFDPTGNRTRVYRFSSRRSIHSTTDRLIMTRPYIGLYKVEFRILEIRISWETNLKTNFLAGNWIRKKSFKAPPKREEWFVLCNFKQPNSLVAFHWWCIALKQVCTHSRRDSCLT